MKNKKKISKVTDLYLTFLIYSVIGYIYEVVWMYILNGELTNRGYLFGPYLPIYGFGMIVLIALLSGIKKDKHPFGSRLTIPTLLLAFLFIFIVLIEYTVPKIYQIDLFLTSFGFPIIIYLAMSVLFIHIVDKNLPKKTKNKIDLTPLIIFFLIFIITTLIEFVAHYMIDKYAGIILWDYTKDYLNFNSRVCFDASRNFAIGGTFLLYCVQPIIERKLNKTDINKKVFYTCFLGGIMLIDLIIRFFFIK